MTNETNSENKFNENQTKEIVTENENKLNIFKQTVKNWLDIDNDIRTLEKAIKDRKNKRKELQSNIMTFMEENNIKNMNTIDGKITFNHSKIKKPFNQKYIKNTLSDYFNNSDDGLKLADYLNDKREITNRTYLKRFIGKN